MWWSDTSYESEKLPASLRDACSRSVLPDCWSILVTEWSWVRVRGGNEILDGKTASMICMVCMCKKQIHFQVWFNRSGCSSVAYLISGSCVMASSSKGGREKRSSFALPKTSVGPSNTDKVEEKPDAVEGLEKSFSNCVEQLKVGYLHPELYLFENIHGVLSYFASLSRGYVVFRLCGSLSNVL